MDSKQDTKDDGLLLPASRAPLQKIFIDDLTETHSRKRSRLWRVPWFLLLMSLVQISMHHIVNGCMQRRLICQSELRHEYWRLFTYMLLHADLWHLWINICMQCFIGLHLELEQGHWRVGVVYVMGGLCGGLASVWLQPGLSLLGASAGVCAMLSSHVPHLALNFSHLSHRFLRIAVLSILLTCNAAYTGFHFYVHHNRNPRISLEAHLGGGVAGLLTGLLVYRRLQRPSPWMDRFISFKNSMLTFAMPARSAGGRSESRNLSMDFLAAPESHLWPGHAV